MPDVAQRAVTTTGADVSLGWDAPITPGNTITAKDAYDPHWGMTCWDSFNCPNAVWPAGGCGYMRVDEKPEGGTVTECGNCWASVETDGAGNIIARNLTLTQELDAQNPGELIHA